MADAGLFTDCASGQRLPVATEGDNAALEAAYSKARPAPGAPVLAVVDGRVELRLPMEGPQRKPTLIVERFVEVVPGSGCPAPAGPAPVENTYWKLVSLRGTPVQLADQQREPHLILQPADRRVVGSGGCNRLMGSYTLEGERLAFSKTAGTMMACPQGVMELERALLDTLPQVTTWRVQGQRLELLDGQGTAVAAFESRYLK
jgi:copper homeostasis protein (lipoprotein)